MLLVYLVVMGTLFSLLYSSNYITARNKEKMFQGLRAASVTGDITPLSNPRPSCIKADQQFLNENPEIENAIRELEEMNREAISTGGDELPYGTGVYMGSEALHIHPNACIETLLHHLRTIVPRSGGKSMPATVAVVRQAHLCLFVHAFFAFASAF